MAVGHIEEVTVPADEVAQGRPSAATVGAAVSAFQRDGIVIIKQVVDRQALRMINTKLVQSTERLAQDPETHFNQGPAAGNLSQGPPTEPALMFETVWANPFTAAVGEAILGPEPRVHYAGGNAAVRTSEGGRQTVHADLAEQHLRFPFAVVVNMYLVDAGPENGSTEVWVGSHRDTSIADHVDDAAAPGGRSSIQPALVEARRAWAPPVQPRIQQGDLVLRDVRLWHAGMPNHTAEPRIMLAFSLFPWWYRPALSIPLPIAARPLVLDWERRTGLRYEVRWCNPNDPPPKFYVTCTSSNPALLY